jgi:phosphate transport system substrate-binding protein
MKKILASMVLVSLVGIVACGGGGSRGDRVLIQNKGSDTLVNVAQAWAEAYKDVDANIVVAVSGGGSGTGISAMINGTVDIANASRKMKGEEIELARANGQDPIEFVVGFDALAVYLHPDNPIDSMTLAQLAGIYGEGGTTDTWSQLGVSVPGCDSDEIVRVSRQNNSGTYVYFQEAVLGSQRDFRMGSRDMHGSKDVVDLVENTPCAIGYSGLAYATEHVKMPTIAADDMSPAVAPSTDTAIDGSYPIARPLLMYTVGLPEGAVKQYMDWVLSDAGQCIILGKGYAPVHAVSCD